MPSARTGADWERAASDLAGSHELAAQLLERHGPPRGISRTPPGARFASLARAIAYQQLSGRAAASIWARVEETVSGDVSPQTILAAPEGSLRSAGLSGSKVRAIRDLATRAGEGSIDLRATARMDDARVVEHLGSVWGVGEWTAHMYLIFDLGRTDVWPTGDLGVRAGWARATGAPGQPTASELQPVGDPFSPWRSVMAWWCWREVDGRGGVS